MLKEGDTKPTKLPVVLEIEEGKPIAIEVRAFGFEGKKVLLDATDSALQKDPKLVVKLDPAKALPKGPAGGKATPTGKKKGGDVVDPWGGN
jgi:hypothetical protein